jgi:protein-L-isoaspartate(D-aspartate) O-methyltransferase
MLPLIPATFDGKRSIPSESVTELMLSMLELKPGEKLLEVGTGSGSQTEKFAATGAEIHSVELEPWVDSTKITGEYVFLYSRDGRLGLPEEAPFDAIVITCGIEEIEAAWQEQLAEGGRLIAPVGEPNCQRLTLFRKKQGEMIPYRVVAYVRFQMLRKPPAPGKIPYEAKAYAS